MAVHEEGNEGTAAREEGATTTITTEKTIPTTTSPPPASSHTNESGSAGPRHPPRPPSQVLSPPPPSQPSAVKHTEIFPVVNPHFAPTGPPVPLPPIEVPYSHSWYIGKLVLSTASVLFCIVVIGLGISIGSWGGTYSVEEAIFGITCATAGLALLWTAAEVMTLCISNSKNRPHRRSWGIHPGAHVGLHLIIWLMTILAVTILGIYRGYYFDGSAPYYRRYGYYYTYYGVEIDRLQAALLAFMVLLLIIHFTLFVRACVETHEVNTTAKLNRVGVVRYVHVPVPAGGFPPGSVPVGFPPGGVYPPPGAVPMPMYPGHPQPPQQAAVYGGYYAPAPPLPAPVLGGDSKHMTPPVDPSVHGYYAPAPAPSPGPSSKPGSSRFSPAPPSTTGPSVPPPS